MEKFYDHDIMQVNTMKILIVEDEEKLAKMVKRGLKQEGYAADYLTDG